MLKHEEGSEKPGLTPSNDECHFGYVSTTPVTITGFALVTASH